MVQGYDRRRPHLARRFVRLSDPTADARERVVAAQPLTPAPVGRGPQHIPCQPCLKTTVDICQTVVGPVAVPAPAFGVAPWPTS
jgi:hypothetical protein